MAKRNFAGGGKLAVGRWPLAEGRCGTYNQCVWYCFSYVGALWKCSNCITGKGEQHRCYYVPLT